MGICFFFGGPTEWGGAESESFGEWDDGDAQWSAGDWPAWNWADGVAESGADWVYYRHFYHRESVRDWTSTRNAWGVRYHRVTRRIRSMILTRLVPCAAIFLAGCGTPQPIEEKYFLIVSNTKSPYWEQVTKGLNQAARELTVSASIAGPGAYDPAAEKEEFKRIAALKPAGILVSVGDPKVLTDEINAAVAAGIPVITVDSDATESKRLFFVGTNNYEAGQIGGRAAAKALNGKGNVVAFRFADQTNMEERLNGYRSVFAQYPQIKLIDTIDIKGDPVVAFDKAKEIIEKKKPDVDAFLSMDGESAKEVAEVLKRKKHKESCDCYRCTGADARWNRERVDHGDGRTKAVYYGLHQPPVDCGFASQQAAIAHRGLCRESELAIAAIRGHGCHVDRQVQPGGLPRNE